jgi:hypothetical protein
LYIMQLQDPAAAAAGAEGAEGAVFKSVSERASLMSNKAGDDRQTMGITQTLLLGEDMWTDRHAEGPASLLRLGHV